MGVYLIGFPSASLQLATTPGDVLYTCPAATHTRLDSLLVINSNAATRTITAYLVRSGGSIGNNNLIINAASVPGAATAPDGRRFYFPEGLVLNPGDFIQAFASAATSLSPSGGVTETT